MVDHDKTKKKVAINPLLKMEDLERLKQAGLKTTHSPQTVNPQPTQKKSETHGQTKKIKNASLSGAHGGTAKKPFKISDTLTGEARASFVKKTMKKPVVKAEMIDGKFAKPINPFDRVTTPKA